MYVMQIYAGTQHSTAGELDHAALSKARGKVLLQLIDAFGGCTRSEGVGSWKDDSTGMLVTERCDIWTVASSLPVEEALLDDCAATVRKAYQQSAVLALTHRADGGFR